MSILLNCVMVILCVMLVVVAWKSFAHIGVIAGGLAAKRRLSRRSMLAYVFVPDVQNWCDSVAESMNRSGRALEFLLPALFLSAVALFGLHWWLAVQLGIRWTIYALVSVSVWHALKALAASTHCLKLIHGESMRDRRIASYATRAVLELAGALFLLLL